MAELFALPDFPLAGDFGPLPPSTGNQRLIIWCVATASENVCGDCGRFVHDSNVSLFAYAANANGYFFFGISAQCSRASKTNCVRLILNWCAPVRLGLTGCGARLSAEDRREAEERRHVPERFHEGPQEQQKSTRVRKRTPSSSSDGLDETDQKLAHGFRKQTTTFVYRVRNPSWDRTEMSE